MEPRDIPTDALAPEAFEAARFFVFPDAAWWQAANPPVDPPTNEELNEKYPDPEPPRLPGRLDNGRSLARNLRATPLPGESRANARSRAKLARSYRGQRGATQRTANLRERQRTTAAVPVAWWRIEATGQLDAVLNSAKGVETVAEVSQTSPWFTVPRGQVVTDDELLRTYYDLVRAMIRSGQGKDVGPSGNPTDGRHGPTAWGDSAVSPVLSDLLQRGVKYENSLLHFVKDSARPHQGRIFLKVRTTPPR